MAANSWTPPRIIPFNYENLHGMLIFVRPCWHWGSESVTKTQVFVTRRWEPPPGTNHHRRAGAFESNWRLSDAFYWLISRDRFGLSLWMDIKEFWRAKRKNRWWNTNEFGGNLFRAKIYFSHVTQTVAGKKHVLWTNFVERPDFEMQCEKIGGWCASDGASGRAEGSCPECCRLCSTGQHWFRDLILRLHVQHWFKENGPLFLAWRHDGTSGARCAMREIIKSGNWFGGDGRRKTCCAKQNKWK